MTRTGTAPIRKPVTGDNIQLRNEGVSRPSRSFVKAYVESYLQSLHRTAKLCYDEKVVVKGDLTLVAQNAESPSEAMEWTLNYVYEKYDTYMQDVPEAPNEDYSFLYDGTTGEYLLEKDTKDQLNALTEDRPFCYCLAGHRRSYHRQCGHLQCGA